MDLINEFVQEVEGRMVEIDKWEVSLTECECLVKLVLQENKEIIWILDKVIWQRIRQVYMDGVEGVVIPKELDEFFAFST